MLINKIDMSELAFHCHKNALEKSVFRQFSKPFGVPYVAKRWRYSVICLETSIIRERPFADCRAPSRLLIMNSVGGAKSRSRRVDVTERTISAEYVGHSCPAWIECIAMHSLWLTRHRGATNEAAEKLESRDHPFRMTADWGRPSGTELPQSSLDKTNEWTSWETSYWPTGRRIRRSLRSW